MVILYVLAGIIVLLTVVLVARGRRHPRQYGPESQASVDGKGRMGTEPGVGASAATNNVQGTG